MIKEWIKSDKNPGITKEYTDPVEELINETAYYDLEDLYEALAKVGTTDTYGFKYEFISDPEIIAGDAISIKEKSSGRTREPTYDEEIAGMPEAIINATLTMEDKKQMLRFFKDFEDFLWKINDELWERSMEWDSDGYPQEEDYETEEEYEKAVQEHLDYEDEERSRWIYSTVRGGFAKEALDYIKKLREEKRMPSYEEIAKMFPKKEKVST